MKISVVCPFYNEELILDKAIEGMMNNLHSLPYEWELIVVNDGSIDGSLAIAQKWARREPRLHVVSYPANQGRGHALKEGINAATGDIVVTTEIDLSWGDDIVRRLADELVRNPKVDFVVASPNLHGGGYKNVPSKRVTVSRLGNKLLGILFSGRFTMNTGMTRAYRRHVIQPLSFREKGKEFHLEVLLKLSALGFKSSEVPAVLEWKDHKLAKDAGQKRKSSSKISQLIFTHLRFAIMANPIRYFWSFALTNFLIGAGFIAAGLVRFLSGQVAIYMLLMGFLLLIFGMIFFGFGIVTAQNRYLMEEIWLSDLKKDNAHDR
jgi:glycosyltransferase involved in cell wall biosynthesis